MGCGCGKKKAARPTAKRTVVSTTSVAGAERAKVYQSATTVRAPTVTKTTTTRKTV